MLKLTVMNPALPTAKNFCEAGRAGLLVIKGAIGEKDIN